TRFSRSLVLPTLRAVASGRGRMLWFVHTSAEPASAAEGRNVSGDDQLVRMARHGRNPGRRFLGAVDRAAGAGRGGFLVEQLLGILRFRRAAGDWARAVLR